MKLETCSIPQMRKGCDNGLYGKFGFMQLDVRKLRLLASFEPGRGAVAKAPVLLFESEYIYEVEGFRPFRVIGTVKSVELSIV